MVLKVEELKVEELKEEELKVEMLKVEEHKVVLTLVEDLLPDRKEYWNLVIVLQELDTEISNLQNLTSLFFM